MKVKRCVDCPYFSYGHNDPTCYHEYQEYSGRRVIPNSGVHADLPPPNDCPLRTQTATVEIDDDM